MRVCATHTAEHTKLGNPILPGAVRALHFSANNHRVSHPAGATASKEALTVIVLLRQRVQNQINKRFIWKSGDLIGEFLGNAGDFFITRIRTTTEGRVEAANGTLTLDRWTWIAWTETAGTAPRCWTAPWSTSVLTEVSYGLQQTGSGTVNSFVNTCFIGGRDAANTEADAEIARVWFMGRLYSEGEIRDFIRRGLYYVPDDCVFAPRYGEQGRLTQFDYSGRNMHGTVNSSPAVVNTPLVWLPDYDDGLGFVAAAPTGGRIWKLASEGGGLAGPAKGLAA